VLLHDDFLQFAVRSCRWTFTSCTLHTLPIPKPHVSI